MPTKRPRRQVTKSEAAAMIRGCTSLAGRLILADWLEERRDLPGLAGLLRQQNVQPNRYANRSVGLRIAHMPLDGDCLVWLALCGDAGVSFVVPSGDETHFLDFQIDAKRHQPALTAAFDELASRGGVIEPPREAFYAATSPADALAYAMGDVDKHNKDQVASLCGVLRQLGVRQVSVIYDGYGDEGHIEDWEFKPDRTLPPGCELALQVLAEAFMPDGYENGEGGFGELHINTRTCKVRREHNWRVVETEYEEEVF